MAAVEVKHLYKSYADVTAVNDLTISVEKVVSEGNLPGNKIFLM